MPRRKLPAGRSDPRLALLRPLGAQLRQLRLEQGLTQEEVAERSGLNYKFIGRVELGQSEPGAESLVRLARALGVPIGKLFETILPKETGLQRLSRADAKAISEALAALTAVVNRVLAGQPPPLPLRAPRRPRR